MENIKVKQKQKIVAIPCAIFMLFFILSISAFAYTDNSVNGIDFTEQPLPYIDNNLSNAETFSQMLTIKEANQDDSTIYKAKTNTQNAIVYCFKASGSSRFTFASDTRNAEIRVWKEYDGSIDNDAGYGTCYIYNSQTGLYYCENSNQIYWNTTTYTGATVPAFNSVQDGFNAVKDWIDNPPPPPAQGHRFADSLAPGYVAIFDVGGLSDINIVLGTSLFSGSKYPNYTTTQAAGMISSLPSSITLPMTGTSSISWGGSGQKNLIGQYQNFSFTEHVTSTFSSQYYVVVNPLSGSAASGTALESSNSNRNNNITILIDKVKSYKTYSLTESVSIGNNGWSEDTSSNGGTTSGRWDDDSGTWVGTNDQTNLPENFNDLPVGGGNTPLVSGSNSINDFLQDIANQIKGFFSGAIGAVSTLVGAGSAFINQLIGLYSWLPAPVYSVLSAALILVITIGVIKVFV